MNKQEGSNDLSSCFSRLMFLKNKYNPVSPNNHSLTARDEQQSTNSASILARSARSSLHIDTIGLNVLPLPEYTRSLSSEVESPPRGLRIHLWPIRNKAVQRLPRHYPNGVTRRLSTIQFSQQPLEQRLIAPSLRRVTPKTKTWFRGITNPCFPGRTPRT